MNLDPLDLLAALRDHVGPWGPNATELQWSDARAVLDPEGPRRHWLGRAKGFSKTRDVAALSITALLTRFPVNSDQKGYVAAADSEQAGLLLNSIEAFVAGTPELQGEIRVDARRVISVKRGTELRVLPADRASVHGIRPCWLAFDEIANFDDTERQRDFFDYAWDGLAKTGGVGIIMTTAGSPSHFAYEIFEGAKVDPMFRVSHVEGPPPWMDPAEIESARLTNLPAKFGRLFENVWQVADDAIASQEDVDAACTLSQPLEPQEGVRYILTVDLGTRHDRSVLVVAHREGDAATGR